MGRTSLAPGVLRGVAVAHLRGHVRRRAHHTPRGVPRRGAVEGHAPVHEVDLAEGPEHHVRGLHVAVDHPLRVRVIDDVQQLRAS